MPGFRIRGKVVAGFASYKRHVGYYPHSGEVFKELVDDLAGYEVSEKGGGVKFPINALVPDVLIGKLIAVRMRQVSGKKDTKEKKEKKSKLELAEDSYGAPKKKSKKG
jgi:uncharacterized protein YdhG (YjbR/CyaY superfamily)